jgi:V/A-type H+-transporting ATPase subunit I
LVYWAGIGVITKLVVDRSPASPLLVNVVIGGFIILFLGPIIKFILQRHGSGFFEAFMHGMVEVLEVGMGYLANTISFLRIAGFALTHACLFLAIFELSKGMKMIPGAGWLILVVGNFIVFCLEGLVVTMQSVRLNYYEFFSKFFIPGKRKYKPLTIPGIESINR